MRSLLGHSLRRKLSALITLLVLATVGAVSLIQTDARDREFARELGRRATLYARLMSRQLEASVAFDDRQTAREVFDSLRLDADVIGIGLYHEDGQLLHGSGMAPQRWGSPATMETLQIDADGLEAVAPVISHEGPRGTVVLRVSTERFARLHAEALRTSTLVALGAGVLALLLSWLIAGTVVLRLQRISEVADRVAEGDLSQRELTPGALDEIGRLTEAFNAMLSHLQRLMRQQHEAAATEQERLNQLVATRTEQLRQETEERKRHEALVAETRIRNARSAGMAEVATGVLHNVGNALNSVGVSAELIGDKVRRSRLPGLAKANALLASHSADLASFLADHPQGKQLQAYLCKLSAELIQEQVDVLHELGGLNTGLSHVSAIISTQQSLAKGVGRTSGREPVPPSLVFEEALTLGLPHSERGGVSVTQDFRANDAVALDRHRLIQVLVNLIGNATHALQGLPPSERRLELTVAVDDGRLRFSVRDNGVGIEPDLKVKIFSHGFTTKKDGHGFGLHASACAAMEMGGTLTCQSQGTGTGSTFLLDLPVVTTAATPHQETA